MKKNKYRRTIEVINSSKKILVLAHVNPDGDSIGCMIALGSALNQLNKQVTLLSADKLPSLYSFMPGIENIVHYLKLGTKFDLCIVVDCDNLERVGSSYEHLQYCNEIIEIDHHLGTTRGDGANIIDTNAAATGEIIYKLLVEMNIDITTDIAESLMTAIITDTGSFRFTNVKPETLRIAADLLEAGASTGMISQKVYDTRTLPSLKLIGIALNNIKTISNGRIAYSFITKQDMVDTGAQDSDTDGIVNYTRSIKGVDIGLFFNETAAETTKISFRARDGYDVSKAAKLFGGGGHKAASGATVEKPLNEAMPMVLDKVTEWMESLT
jgi:phosphoesterase RecJ-like protein